MPTIEVPETVVDLIYRLKPMVCSLQKDIDALFDAQQNLLRHHAVLVPLGMAQAGNEEPAKAVCNCYTTLIKNRSEVEQLYLLLLMELGRSPIFKE